MSNDPVNSELEKSDMILSNMEKLIVSQHTDYMTHIERLGGLKYIHSRLRLLSSIESWYNYHNWEISKTTNEERCSSCGIKASTENHNPVCTTKALRD
jgi:hypothetical protein